MTDKQPQPQKPQSQQPAPARPTQRQRSLRSVWADRLIGLCPVAVMILWVAGVALTRGYQLTPVQWMSVVAGAFALHVVAVRLWHRRPLPPLPEKARAMSLAALIATIWALIVCVVGGGVELIAQNYLPSEVPWGLRMLWHAGCTFAAAYCAFLQRLLRVLPP